MIEYISLSIQEFINMINGSIFIYRKKITYRISLNPFINVCQNSECIFKRYLNQRGKSASTVGSKAFESL